MMPRLRSSSRRATISKVHSFGSLETALGTSSFTLLSQSWLVVVWDAQKLIYCGIELHLPLEYVSPESFPLPTLGNKLKTMATELTSGVGFFHIRGLDPQRYSNERNVILYLGIATYIGGKRGRQDELGNMLRAFPHEDGFLWRICWTDIRDTVHLTDLGSAAAPDNERQAPYSNVGQVSTILAGLREWNFLIKQQAFPY